MWWVLSTFIFPVLVPLCGLFFGKIMPLDKAKYGKKTSFWSQFRDGQLGWVSVAWSIAAIYEIKHYNGRSGWLDDLEGLAYALTALGTLVSAAGAIEADPADKPKWYFFVLSLLIAAGSAYVFYNSHVTVEALEKTESLQNWCNQLHRLNPTNLPPKVVCPNGDDNGTGHG
jgi:hypothetical protein